MYLLSDKCATCNCKCWRSASIMTQMCKSNWLNSSCQNLAVWEYFMYGCVRAVEEGCVGDFYQQQQQVVNRDTDNTDQYGPTR